MEQHGPHLPVGVDTILCEGVCKAGAEAVAAECPVVVAPTLWCGMAEHHMAFGGTFTFDIPTYRAVLLAFLRSIERHGFKRVLHRQRPRRQHRRAQRLPARLRARDRLEDPRRHLLRAGGVRTSHQMLEDQKGVQHACEVETSLMLVLAPDTVKRERIPEAFGGVPARTRPTLVRPARALPLLQGVHAQRRQRRRAPGEPREGREARWPSASRASPAIAAQRDALELTRHG